MFAVLEPNLSFAVCKKCGAPMNDFLIVIAFFLMVLTPCVIAIFSFRHAETADPDPVAPPQQRRSAIQASTPRPHEARW